MPDYSHYFNLPYSIVLRRDDEGDFIARVHEFPGCIAHGPTPEKALENLRDIESAWIQEREEGGLPIPEPDRDEELPSGKWVQRVPRSLHKKLTALAQKENVSLNQLVTSLLAEAVGERHVERAEDRYAGWGDVVWATTGFIGTAEAKNRTFEVVQHHGAYLPGLGVQLQDEVLRVRKIMQSVPDALSWAGHSGETKHAIKREKVRTD